MTGAVSLSSLCAEQMSDDLRRRQLKLDPIFSRLDFHHSFGETLVSDNDLKRGSHQIRIVEFHTGPFVPIVPQHFEPCRLQFVIQLLGDLCGLRRLGEREEMDMEWRDGEGPDNAFCIVILFDRRCGCASDPDAVASHDGEAFFAVKIQKRGLHGFAVFGAEHEHMSDLDASRRLQDPVFLR